MTATPKPWTVLRDPTGTFTGPFSWREICQTAAWGYWPEGIEFQHQYKKQWVAVFQGGNLYKNGKRVKLSRYIRGLKDAVTEVTP